ncbi:hypothetical protein [Mucilaginibacter sp.]
MGKNIAGSTHEHKGQPSGNQKESSGIKDAFAGTTPERDEQLASEYTNDGGDGDETAENVHLLHHNRNPDKGDTMKDTRK